MTNALQILLFSLGMIVISGIPMFMIWLKDRSGQCGRVRIVRVGEEYRVQTMGLLGWHNDGPPHAREYFARGWAEHLVESRRARRLPPPPPEVIAEYKP